MYPVDPVCVFSVINSRRYMKVILQLLNDVNFIINSSKKIADMSHRSKFESSTFLFLLYDKTKETLFLMFFLLSFCHTSSTIK